MSTLRMLLLFLTLSMVAAPVAGARTDSETVVQDDALFLHGTEAQIRTGLQQARTVGIGRVRLTAGWSVIAPSPTADTVPSGDLKDPAAYPLGAWNNLDRAVRLTVEAGMRPMIDIAFWAPRWAIQGQAGETTRMRTNIDPGRYADFSTAVARRYAGGYVPSALGSPNAPSSPPPDSAFLGGLFGRSQTRPAPAAAAPAEVALPAVDLFTIWNEPNHPGFLLPQWRLEQGRYVPNSPDLYRAMVLAAYPAIKGAAPNSRVLVGGTSSGGSSIPGRAGVPPLMFLRRLACVDDRMRPLTTGSCAGFQPIPGDGWSHHPYSLRTLPDVLPKDANQLPVSTTRLLAGTLRQLVAAGRMAPGNATIYMTEYGYETNAPDPKAPFTPAQQGRLLAWAEYLATRDPAVVMWPQFQLVDRPGGPSGPKMRLFGDWQTGLIFADGTLKPAYAEYATPGFAACQRVGGRRWIMVWGRLRGAEQPAAGQVQIRRAASPRAAGGQATEWTSVLSDARPRPGAVRALRGQSLSSGATVTRFIRWRRGLSVRMVWQVPGQADRPGVELSPRPCPADPRASLARVRR